MANNRTILKDQNQSIRSRHNHTNRLESWPSGPIQAYSSHVPALGGQEGILIVCDCGKEAWLGFSDRRRR